MCDFFNVLYNPWKIPNSAGAANISSANERAEEKVTKVLLVAFAPRFAA